ncbi:MAG: hypothetical protein Q9159_001033 [Coniocarpon cinnabarinum]
MSSAVQISEHFGRMESAFAVDVVPMAPEDPLFGLMAQYKEDQDPKKVDLGIGAYRDDNAKPVILSSVKKADDRLRSDPELNHEYLPIAGLPTFTSAAQKVILGADSPAIKEKRNPTGVDPTREQWEQIAKTVRAKKHFPFFDCAYQGFASGDLDRDAWAVRYFIDQGFELCIAQSFAKNLGLYGERVGCFHFVTSPGPNAQDTAARVASQLAIVQRSEISNPPAYGARIASTILNDWALFQEWTENLKEMSGRIMEMRRRLRSRLEELGTPGSWKAITEQIGMFSFTGLTEEQVLKVRKDAHVYMTKNGRASIAGLNTKNVDYVAEAIDKAVRETTPKV